MGKDLIIGGLIRNMRKQEKAPKDKFKHLVKLGNVIDFTWWDLYGKGQAERIIVSTDSEGRPQVKFKDTYWTIEWIEIVDIKEHGWYTKERDGLAHGINNLSLRNSLEAIQTHANIPRLRWCPVVSSVLNSLEGFFGE